MKGLSKRSLFLASFLFSVFLISMVSSANTALITPATNGMLNGSTFNISVSLDTNSLNYDNASFYYRVNSGVWQVIGNDSNGTGNPSATNFSIIWSVTGFEDSETVYDINVTFTNATLKSSSAADNNVNTTTAVNLFVNNGNPTAALASNHIHNNYQVGKTDTFVWAINADNTIGIKNCTIIAQNTQNNSIIKGIMTATSNACSNNTDSATTLGLPVGSTYLLYVQAGDANGNKTNSSSRILKVVPTTFKKDDTRREPEVATPGVGGKIRGLGKGLVTAMQNIPDFAKGVLETIKSWFNR